MHTFITGVRRGLPVVLGYIPLGLACGLLLKNAGLVWWKVGLMSLLVFGGSAQFAAAALIAQQASAFEVILTIILLNCRQILYSISLSSYVQAEPSWKVALLTNFTADESYALNVVAFQDNQAGREEWTIDQAIVCALVTYLSWVISTVLGAFVGQFVNLPSVIMNFVMTAMFIGLLIPQLTSRLVVSVTILSGLLTIVLQRFLPNAAVIVVVTLLGSFIGYLLEKKLTDHLINSKED